MRPLSLRIEGLRSFRKEVDIDFGDRDHIAVVGDTGAGKSSILEAMTYALYGKTSFSGQVGELMNDTSDKMRVVLRFRVSGEEWEVVRTLRRSKGRALSAKAQLQCVDKDGKSVEQVEQVRLVNDRVEQLIGLDSTAFLRTVVLPQGRFARLLVEDSPADRSKVLRKVWPTDDLEAVGALANRAADEVRHTRVRLQQEAEAHPEDPEARLAELTASAEAAEEHAKEAEALVKEASQATSAMQDAAQRERTATEQGARLEPGLARIDEAEAQVAPVAEIERRIDKEDRELKQKQAGVRDQLENLPSDDDGPGRREVADALAKLRDFGRLTIEATEAADRMRTKAAEVASRQKAAAQAKEAAATATEAKERHAKLRLPLAQACDAAEIRRREAEQAHNNCGRLHNSAAEAHAEVASLEQERTQRASEAEAADKEHAQATEVAAAEESRLAEARRVGSAAAAARGLDPGDDCPVCRRDLPEDWTPPVDEGLDEAEDVAGKARREDEMSAQRATQARTRLQSVEDQLRRAQSDAEAASAECRAAVDEIVARFSDSTLDAASYAHAATLAEGAAAPPEAASDPAEAASGPDAAGGEPPPLPSLLPLAPFLAPLDDRVRKASTALDRHDQEHQDLADQMQQLSQAAAAAEANADGARNLAEDTRAAAVRALDQLKRNASETPLPYRPEVGLPGDPTELDRIDSSAAGGLVAQAEERQSVLEYRDTQRRKFREELDQANQAREALARRREAEVEHPLAVVAKNLGPHRDAVLRARDALSASHAPSSVPDAPSPGTPSSPDDAPVAADLPSLPDTKDPASLTQWMHKLRDANSALVEVAADLAKQAASDAQAARDRLVDVGRRLAAQRAVQQPSEDDETDAGDAQAASAAFPEAPVAPVAPVDPATVLSATREARDDANHRARNAVRARDDFAAMIDDLRTLRALLQEAEELEHALSDLHKAFMPGAFLKWLTLRRSRRLLTNASRVLREISGDRYAFADPGDDEVSWSVLDKESGQPRSPASLSGGEQFIASLALALGMVEMMASTGGRLESLFLDEGFGSLDRNNLDAAVEALGTVAAQGRMVGVISHVRAVAEQIDHVLAVVRTAAGSQAKWLSRTERNRLSVSDAGSEAAEAMQGLLE